MHSYSMFIYKAPTNTTKNTLLSNGTKKSFQKLMNFYQEDRLQEYVFAANLATK